MKFKINFNINVSLMTFRDFWRLIYLIARLEKNNVRTARPIISSCGTYNVNLARYLDSIIKPLKTVQNIKDTFELVNRVSKLPTHEQQRMVSFDVESLFTNIQVKETIDLILDNRAFKDKNEYFHDMNRETLERLFTICT